MSTATSSGSNHHQQQQQRTAAAAAAATSGSGKDKNASKASGSSSRNHPTNNNDDGGAAAGKSKSGPAAAAANANAKRTAAAARVVADAAATLQSRILDKRKKDCEELGEDASGKVARAAWESFPPSDTNRRIGGGNTKKKKPPAFTTSKMHVKWLLKNYFEAAQDMALSPAERRANLSAARSLMKSLDDELKKKRKEAGGSAGSVGGKKPAPAEEAAVPPRRKQPAPGETIAADSNSSRAAQAPPAAAAAAAAATRQQPRQQQQQQQQQQQPMEVDPAGAIANGARGKDGLVREGQPQQRQNGSTAPTREKPAAAPQPPTTTTAAAAPRGGPTATTAATASKTATATAGTNITNTVQRGSGQPQQQQQQRRQKVPPNGSSNANATAPAVSGASRSAGDSVGADVGQHAAAPGQSKETRQAQQQHPLIQHLPSGSSATTTTTTTTHQQQAGGAVATTQPTRAPTTTTTTAAPRPAVPAVAQRQQQQPAAAAATAATANNSSVQHHRPQPIVASGSIALKPSPVTPRAVASGATASHQGRQELLASTRRFQSLAGEAAVGTGSAPATNSTAGRPAAASSTSSAAASSGIGSIGGHQQRSAFAPPPPAMRSASTTARPSSGQDQSRQRVAATTQTGISAAAASSSSTANRLHNGQHRGYQMSAGAMQQSRSAPASATAVRIDPPRQATSSVQQQQQQQPKRGGPINGVLPSSSTTTNTRENMAMWMAPWRPDDLGRKQLQLLPARNFYNCACDEQKDRRTITFMQVSANQSVEVCASALERFAIWDPFWQPVSRFRVFQTCQVAQGQVPDARTALTLTVSIENDLAFPNEDVFKLIPKNDWGVLQTSSLRQEGRCALILRMLPIAPDTKKRADCHLWPKGTYLKYNGTPVKLEQRKQQAHDRKLWKGICQLQDLTPQIRDPTKEFNIDLCCFDEQQYVFALAICKYRSVDTLFEALTARKSKERIVHLSRQEGTKKIAKFVQGSILSLDSDDEHEEHLGKFVFSLICPISKKVIETPVRGRSCCHWQCYDLRSYLETCEPYCGGRWRCASCEKFVGIKDLEVCGLTAEFLEEFPRSKSKSGRKSGRVEYSESGTYRFLEAPAQKSRGRQRKEPSSAEAGQGDSKRQRGAPQQEIHAQDVVIDLVESA